jgi:hypothetical protein
MAPPLPKRAHRRRTEAKQEERRESLLRMKFPWNAHKVFCQIEDWGD